jgi:hypothetical protein
MTTIGSNVLTLADHAKRLDPDGKISKIVEMMSQTNDVLQDMKFMEGNLVTGHQTTIRTGLPSVYWRQLNAGVPPSKSRTAQVTETVGMLEAWSEVDCALAKLGGDPAGFRLSEASAFIEAMGQEFASTTFYGTAANPEEFIGLSSRYSSLSAANAENILDAAGTGNDLASIWLLVWGEQQIHGIYPKGSQAGLQHFDHGEETVENAGGVTGAKMRAYRDQFTMSGGLVVKDWRYGARICNIDVSNLRDKSSAADLTEFMIKALKRIPAINAGKAAFYMNRSCEQYLDIQRKDAVMAGGQFSYDVVDGKQLMSFRGVPIRRCDVLLESESRVT